MLKFLLVLLVVGIGVWSLVAKLRGPRKDRPAERPSTSALPVQMVACAHCGVHLPAADALTDGAHPYCSDAHRRLGPAQPPQA
jgi:uncharacterized protein